MAVFSQDHSRANLTLGEVVLERHVVVIQEREDMVHVLAESLGQATRVTVDRFLAGELRQSLIPQVAAARKTRVGKAEAEFLIVWPPRDMRRYCPLSAARPRHVGPLSAERADALVKRPADFASRLECTGCASIHLDGFGEVAAQRQEFRLADQDIGRIGSEFGRAGGEIPSRLQIITVSPIHQQPGQLDQKFAVSFVELEARPIAQDGLVRPAEDLKRNGVLVLPGDVSGEMRLTITKAREYVLPTAKFVAEYLDDRDLSRDVVRRGIRDLDESIQFGAKRLEDRLAGLGKGAHRPGVTGNLHVCDLQMMERVGVPAREEIRASQRAVCVRKTRVNLHRPDQQLDSLVDIAVRHQPVAIE